MAGSRARNARHAPGGFAGRRTATPLRAAKTAAADAYARKGGDHLAVTIPVLTMLTVTVIVLCRYAGLRVIHAVVCVLLGFYLASSQFAPAIANAVASVIRLL